jgi:hypothetical protein
MNIGRHYTHNQHGSPQIKTSRSVNETPDGGMGEIVRHGIHKNPTPPPDRAREQPLLHLRCRDAEEEETFIETNKAKNNISKIGEQGFPPPQTEHSRSSTKSPIARTLF